MSGTMQQVSAVPLDGLNAVAPFHAGMQATAPLAEQPVEYFQQVMDTNVMGSVRMIQAVTPAMLARVSASRRLFKSHKITACSVVSLCNSLSLRAAAKLVLTMVQDIGVDLICGSGIWLENSSLIINRCSIDANLRQQVCPQGSGLIVNICSVSSYMDLPLSAAYSASKAALLSLTNCLRMETQPLGVHVMG